MYEKLVPIFCYFKLRSGESAVCMSMSHISEQLWLIESLLLTIKLIPLLDSPSLLILDQAAQKNISIFLHILAVKKTVIA